MIIPTVIDVVRSISRSVDLVIAPSLEGLRERSAITTIRHMLRYVERAVELEGQNLFEEAARVRALLVEIADKLESRDVNDALTAVAAAARELTSSPRDPSVYPSVSLLAEDIRALTQCVDTCLSTIHAIAIDARDPVTVEVHEAIRTYMIWQIEHEAHLVEPAFYGFGARR